MKHKGSTDSTTTGICGIKKIWLPVLHGQDINSLQAGATVISFLLQKHKGNVRRALMAYKGAHKDKKQVAKVLRIIKRGVKW